MKQFIHTSFCHGCMLMALLLTTDAIAQNNVGIGTTSPDASAVLDITSTDQGILVPRMSSAERQGIVSPAIGLMVYDSTANAFYYFNEIGWHEVLSGHVGVLVDEDGDTNVQVEATPDCDIISMSLGGVESFTLSKNPSGITLLEFPNSGANSTVLGSGAGVSLTTGDRNVFVGKEAGESTQNGSKNTYVGFRAGELGSGNSNTYMGMLSGSNNNGSRNVLIGAESGLNNDGSGNVFIGSNAGRSVIGSNKLIIHNVDADSDSALIYGEFDNHLLRVNGRVSPVMGMTDGDGDTRIQLEGSPDEDVIRFDVAGTELMILEDSIATLYSTKRNALTIRTPDNLRETGLAFRNSGGVYTWSMHRSPGAFSDLVFSGGNTHANPDSLTERMRITRYGDVGIGTAAPDALLHVAGTIKIEDGSAQNGFVLTSDSTGLASWQKPESHPVIIDSDGDTRIHVEENADEDVIRFYAGDTEVLSIEEDEFHNTRIGNVGSNKHNMSIGTNAGISLDGDAFHNVLIGAGAGRDLTTGDANTVLGRAAGTLNTTGNGNTYLGNSAGYSNVTGQSNTFVGRSAGQFNTGSANIFIGRSAGQNTTGSNQLFIENSEADSLNALIYGEFDTDLLRINGTLHIGDAYAFPTADGMDDQALKTDGAGNLAFAFVSTLSDDDSDTKIQVEESADEDVIRFDLGGSEKVRLSQNDQGNPLLVFSSNQGNLFLGSNGGADIDASGPTISDNTFIGIGSGSGVETGEGNTYIGHNAGSGNVFGSGNIFIGDGAGQNSSGDGLLIIDNGFASGPIIEGQAGLSSLDEHELSLHAITKADAAVSGDTAFVFTVNNATTSNGGSTQFNGLKIEAGRDVNNSANSKMIAFHRPDDTEIGKIVQNNSGSVSYSTSSDIRLKTNITGTRYALNDLLNIQVKDYEYKSEPGTITTGFLAQQLYSVYPDAVTPGGVSEKTDPWMVDYGKLTPLLVKAVQDLADEVEALRAQVTEQQKMLKELR